MAGVRTSILCPHADHPVNAWLELWADRKDTRVDRSIEDLPGGDFLFLISCDVIVPKEARQKYRHVLVIHASDLPADRGWSPHIWAILEGRSEITVSLLNADDPVDSGDIWRQEQLSFAGTETCDEINARLFEAELRLMDWALDNCDSAEPRKQKGEASYRPRRHPNDSEVRPDQTIAEIFDLLRVSDPNRYPAHFYHRGEKYVIAFRKAGD